MTFLSIFFQQINSSKVNNTMQGFISIINVLNKHLRVAESVRPLDILYAKKPGPNKIKTREGIFDRVTFCSHVCAGINFLSLSNGSLRCFLSVSNNRKTIILQGNKFL